MSECTECSTDVYLHDGVCYEECPEGVSFSPDDDGNVCISCSDYMTGCLECTNSTYCSSCDLDSSYILKFVETDTI